MIRFNKKIRSERVYFITEFANAVQQTEWGLSEKVELTKFLF